MNPSQLLAHFDRISEAPNAIPRLRQFILDLAVRGKLLDQDPNDEPASDLLKRIHEAKLRRIKSNEFKKEKSLLSLDEDNLPFDIPENWAWSQLADIGFLNPRNNAPDDLLASFVPMPLISAEYGVANRHEVRLWGEIKNGFTHFAEGDVALAKITPCFENGKSTVFRGLSGGLGAGTTELHVIRPIYTNADYVLLFLKCPHYIHAGMPKMTGTAGQKRVPTEYFAYSHFPLPPLAEQDRIVAKVNELMGLCNQLEEAQAEQERQRDRLLTASMQRLNNSANTESFREHTSFHLQHFSRLTGSQKQIQQLRQTILKFAIRGFLVPQFANDEPTSVSLKLIHEEKAQFTKQNKLNLRYAPHVRDEEIPFKVPPTWCWVKANDISLNITDGFHNTPLPTTEGRPYITAKHVKPKKIDFSNCLYVDERNHKELFAKTRVKRGDILVVNIGAGCGTPAIIEVDFEFSFKNVAIINLPTAIDPLYVFHFLMSYRILIFDELIKGGAQPFLSLSMLREMLIPLPPLDEQHRIVAKVEELMALCDQLEAQLTNTQTESHLLLEAVLQQALTSET